MSHLLRTVEVHCAFVASESPQVTRNCRWQHHRTRNSCRYHPFACLIDPRKPSMYYTPTGTCPSSVVLSTWLFMANQSASLRDTKSRSIIWQSQSLCFLTQPFLWEVSIGRGLLSECLDLTSLFGEIKLKTFVGDLHTLGRRTRYDEESGRKVFFGGWRIYYCQGAMSMYFRCKCCSVETWEKIEARTGSLRDLNSQGFVPLLDASRFCESFRESSLQHAMQLDILRFGSLRLKTQFFLFAFGLPFFQYSDGVYLHRSIQRQKALCKYSSQ